jgi:hypothetical protein
LVIHFFQAQMRRKLNHICWLQQSYEYSEAF